MKKVVLRSILCAAVTVFPGMAAAQSDVRTGNRADRMEQVLEKRAEKMADDLQLEGDARTSFLKTYKDFQSELMAHRTKKAFPNEETKNASDLTEEEAAARVKAEFDRKAQQIVDLYNSLEVEKKYYDIFSQNLSSRQLMKIFVTPQDGRRREGSVPARRRGSGNSFGGFGGETPQGDLGSDAGW